MHNNFSKSYNEKDAFQEILDKNVAYEVVMNKFIPITWEDDLSYNYEDKPYLKYLYDLIDFNKFWFYKEEGVTKYGGQTEWAIKNFDINEVSNDNNFPNSLWQESAPVNPGASPLNTEELIKYLEKTNWWHHTSPYLNRKFVKQELAEFLGKPESKLI